MTVADFDCCCLRILHGFFETVYIYIIISDTLHFRKFHRISSLSLAAYITYFIYSYFIIAYCRLFGKSALTNQEEIHYNRNGVFIYASNESKSVLARDLDDCRDNEQNSQSVFWLVLPFNL